MRLLRAAALTLLALAVPVFLVSTSARAVIHSTWLYSYGFERYDRARATGMEMGELLRVSREIKAYFLDDADRLDVRVVRGGVERPLFNEREILHMVDVKGLMRGLAGLQLLSVAGIAAVASGMLLLARRAALPGLARALLWGGGLTVWLVLLAGIASVVAFGPLFTMFHQLSFNNDLWLLDPRTDYLLMMFPEGFFRDAALAIALLSIAAAALTGAAARAYLGLHRSGAERGR